MSFEKGPSAPVTPEEKLADAEKRLAAHLEVVGSDDEKNEITKNFYLNELGYEIEGRGPLRGKVRLLNKNKSEEKEYVIDPETGEPKEFKTHFKLPKGETPLIGFLRQELREKLGLEIPSSKERRLQERLDLFRKSKKAQNRKKEKADTTRAAKVMSKIELGLLSFFRPEKADRIQHQDLKRLKEINEKIEQADAPWVIRVMLELKSINKKNKNFRLLKFFKPEDVDRLKQMSQDKGWKLSDEGTDKAEGIDKAKTQELAFDFIKEVNPVFKEKIDLLSDNGKIKLELKEISYLYKIYIKAEAVDAPRIFEILKEMIVRGQKDEAMSLKPRQIDKLSRAIKENPDIEPQKGLTKSQLETLIKELKQEKK